MKISVITVCLNAAETIADTLKSVGIQTYGNIEHVVVDGGSTDRTKEVIENWSGSTPLLVTGPDNGIYDAMNKGIRASSGDVIAFLNANDYYADKFVVEDMARHMMTQQVEVLCADVAFIGSGSATKIRRIYSSRRFHPERIRYGWMPAHPSMFVKKSLFERHGLFNASYKIAGDYEFVARIFSRGNVRYGYLPRIVVNMRSGGVSNSGIGNTIRLNREVVRACKENGIDTNLMKIMTKYPEKIAEYIRAWRYSKNN